MSYGEKRGLWWLKYPFILALQVEDFERARAERVTLDDLCSSEMLPWRLYAFEHPE